MGQRRYLPEMRAAAVATGRPEYAPHRRRPAAHPFPGPDRREARRVIAASRGGRRAPVLARRIALPAAAIACGERP